MFCSRFARLEERIEWMLADIQTSTYILAHKCMYMHMRVLFFAV